MTIIITFLLIQMYINRVTELSLTQLTDLGPV